MIVRLRSFQWVCVLILAVAFLCLVPGSLALPPGFAQTDIGGSWDQVAGLAFNDDGSRLFVVERSGRVWIVEGGAKLPTPFLDISDEVGGWRDFGLLGFAFHPNFDQNGFVYALYVVDRYYLFNHGTTGYDPGLLESQQKQATIGRIARFTADSANDFKSVIPGSQVILVGATVDDGIPILHESHGTGQLVFGQDNTLLATNGDGASYSSTDTGSAGETYFVQAQNDGIIEPWENIGAMRSQSIDAYNGKVLRIDPITGAGVPSNPWFDSAEPFSVRSRAFAVGLRNPYRFTRRPGTGSHDPADGEPGVFYIGDVGWGGSEDLQILSQPGQNFGWPLYEGMGALGSYQDRNTENPFAKNPAGGNPGCTQPFLRFEDLLIQEVDTAVQTPLWLLPCGDPGEEIPDSWVDPSDGKTYTYQKFMHARPPISWRAHAWVSGFDGGGNAVFWQIDEPGSPVVGSDFAGNASTGGVWYTGTDFPTQWQNSYFHADYGAGWIKNFRLDAADDLLEVVDFVPDGNSVTFVSTNPASGGIYYVKWGDRVREIRFVGDGNTPPVAVASSDVTYGPGPLTVAFTGSGSYDIDDGDTLTYSWDFGDGNSSTDADPSHLFDVLPAAGVQSFLVRLTVTDASSNVDDAEILISVNNSPPSVTIDSPVDGLLYTMVGGTTYDLLATIDDVEHDVQLGEVSCSWLVELVHNEHSHPEPLIPGCASQFTITPTGCDGNEYSWHFALTATDDGGLATTAHASVYPDCSSLPNQPPLAIQDFAQVPQGLSADVSVLINDFDPDGALDPSTVSVVVAPQYGTTSVDFLTGVVTYTHDGSENPTDQFSYTVDDDEGAASNPAPVFVSSFNNPPTGKIIAPADGATYEDGEFLVLEARGTDPEEGTNVSYDWEVQLIRNGTIVPDFVTWSGPNPPLFQVGPSVHGLAGDAIAYRFNVTISDGPGETVSDTVRINLSVPPAGQQPPIPDFSPSPASGTVPLAVTFDAAASSDPEGDSWSTSGSSGTDRRAAVSRRSTPTRRPRITSPR